MGSGDARGVESELDPSTGPCVCRAVLKSSLSFSAIKGYGEERREACFLVTNVIPVSSVSVSEALYTGGVMPSVGVSGGLAGPLERSPSKTLLSQSASSSMTCVSKDEGKKLEKPKTTYSLSFRH